MKTKINLFLFLIGLLITPFFTNANAPKAWASLWSTPTDIVTSVASLANENQATKVQDTRLNAINNQDVGGATITSEYQIASTFARLANSENGITPYIQWMIYIWMVWATILLAWNWFLLVTGKKINEAKENIKYIILWVILMAWFYAVIAIVTAIINYFFA
jgi:hypothetical protein